MRVSDLSPPALSSALASEGIGLDLGAASVRVRSSVTELVGALQQAYGAYPLRPDTGLFDVTVDLRGVGGLRSLVAPQIELWVDGATPFERFPRDTPLPLLEWGINYALAARLCCYLLLHAGSVAREGDGVLLPAMPGSGKSTLTAALSRRGYRLLSDEFGVLRPADGSLLALLRPIALKNASIDVIRAMDPSVVLGPAYPKTRKGTVAHLAPRASDADAVVVPVRPRLVVFPQFEAGRGPAQVESVPPTRAFARLAVNSFNYDTLGPDGFETLADLAERCPAYEMTYGSLDDAVARVDALLDEHAQH